MIGFAKSGWRWLPYLILKVLIDFWLGQCATFSSVNNFYLSNLCQKNQPGAPRWQAWSSLGKSELFVANLQGNLKVLSAKLLRVTSNSNRLPVLWRRRSRWRHRPDQWRHLSSRDHWIYLLQSNKKSWFIWVKNEMNEILKLPSYEVTGMSGPNPSSFIGVNLQSWGCSPEWSGNIGKYPLEGPWFICRLALITFESQLV